MREAVTEKHTDWIEAELQPLLDDVFTGIVLNNLSEGPAGKLYNRTFVLGGTTGT